MSGTESKLQFSLILNAKHEGEVCGITQSNISDAVRQGVTEFIKDELADDEAEVQMSLYFSEFEYSDNLDSMRSIINESLTTCDAEILTQILEVINNG